MSDFHFDRRQVRRNFGRAAGTYEKHDALQREVQSTLIERLDVFPQVPEVVLDVGAGTGRGAAALKKKYPMLKQAKQNAAWLKPFSRVVADAYTLPVPDHSVDVLFSNLCFQWCEDLSRLFAECARVLKPGGLLTFSSLGPDTLQELRAAWATADEQAHVARFLDIHDIGDAMLAQGLKDPVLFTERYTLTYPTPRAVLDELRGLGANNADADRQRGLTGKQHYKRMLDAYEAMRTDGTIPSTWEVVTAHAWGPPEGQSRREGSGEIASFSIDKLRGSRRKTPFS
jgi:malonyl-CoA O-methyltransferase